MRVGVEIGKMVAANSARLVWDEGWPVGRCGWSANSAGWGGDREDGGGEQYEVGWRWRRTVRGGVEMAANSVGWGGDGGEQCGLVQFASLPC